MIAGCMWEIHAIEYNNFQPIHGTILCYYVMMLLFCKWLLLWSIMVWFLWGTAEKSNFYILFMTTAEPIHSERLIDPWMDPFAWTQWNRQSMPSTQDTRVVESKWSWQNRFHGRLHLDKLTYCFMKWNSPTHFSYEYDSPNSFFGLLCVSITNHRQFFSSSTRCGAYRWNSFNPKIK